MPTTHQGGLNAAGLWFGIVASRWNEFITERLLSGALEALVRSGASEEQIEVARVPGAWEIPVAVRAFAVSGRIDAVIAIGCLIRGETPHFDYLASGATGALASLSVETGIPIAYGILTVDTLEQAIERAGAKAGNKGAEAALAAIEMAALLKQVNG